MFVPDSTILIAAHKYTGSQEIMQRIRYAYEDCPDFIRAGVTNVTNRTPPLSFYSANDLSWGVNSDQGGLMGRTVQLGLTHKF